MSGSGISWAVCKSAPCSRQITMPAPHHSVFTGRMPLLPPSQQRQSTEGNREQKCATVSCFSKIQIGFTFLVPAHLGSPGRRAVKRMYVLFPIAHLSRFPADCRQFSSRRPTRRNSLSRRRWWCERCIRHKDVRRRSMR